MSIPCKMIPLGNSGLPNGYKRLEYIESIGVNTNGQYILTGVKPTPDTWIDCNMCPGLMQDKNVNFGFVATTNASKSFQLLISGNSGIGGAFYWPPTGAMASVLMNPEWGVMGNFRLKDKKVYVNGIYKGTCSNTPWEATSVLGLGGIYATQRSNTMFGTFKMGIGDELQVNFVPALNPSGIPGVFDTVAKTFKKSATSTPFTAGMNLRQVRDINLPVPGTVNKLSLSIPCEVYNDTEAWGAIEAAQQKGWTFTFYWTNVVAYLTPQLNDIVGSGNYTISYDYQTSKLSLVFTLSVTREQIDEVESLLESVLSKDVVTEIDEMPTGFTRLEYLQGSGAQYIVTTHQVTPETGVRAEYQEVEAGVVVHEAVGTRASGKYWFVPRKAVNDAATNKQEFYYYTPSFTYLNNWGRVIAELNYKNSGNVYLENLLGDSYQKALPSKQDIVLPPLKLFGSNPQIHFKGLIWECEVTEEEEIVSKFVSALDPTGAPCMFDTVTRKAFYNAGTGDFIYPGKETEATTYSLRNRMYAQYTEHGIRRLYHVPKGYNGGKEEYAAEHGFKLLVETPMPEEGYWQPVWHDREDCIELEWVETEAPAELPDVPSEELPE